MWGGIVCNANLIKSNIFVFLSFLHPLFFKVRSLECELMNWVRILNSEFFFFEFGTPWVRYLNIKGFFLKFLGVNEDFQRARVVNPSFGYINPIWAATEYIFIAHNFPTSSQSTPSCYQKHASNRVWLI
jgi:hypothetical protein